MNDIPWPAKEILVALLRHKEVSLRYMQVSKRVVVVDIRVRLVHKKSRRIKRINACKVARADLVKLASQAKALARADADEKRNGDYATQVVSAWVRNLQATERSRLRTKLGL